MQRSLILFLLGLAAGAALLTTFSAATADQHGGAANLPFPRYTVVETDGLHLIVTDGQSNTLYFYAVEPGGSVGEDLQLRGSLDLSDVGKPSLKPHVVE